MVKTLGQKTAKAVVPASKEELEIAAYFHWLNRGCPSNDDLTDWIEVEKEAVRRGAPSTTVKTVTDGKGKP